MRWPDEPMVGLDLESTSANPYEALPVSFAIVEFDKGEVVKGRTALVKPGIPIPPETTKIHGITDEMVQAKGGDLSRFTEGMLGVLLDTTARGIPLAGMNLRYDLCVLNELCKTYMKHSLRELGWDGLVLDALVLDRHLDKYRKGKRNLPALCDTYGCPPVKAHDASSDVVAAYKVIRAMAKQYPDLRGADPEELQPIQQFAHDEWARSYNKYRVEKSQEPLADTEYGWPLPEDRVPAVAPDHTGDLLASRGEITSVLMRMQNELGVSDRAERLWITGEVVGRPVGTTKDLTEAEYRDLVGYLDTVAGHAGAAVLVEEARKAIAAGWHPPEASGPPQARTEGAPREMPEVYCPRCHATLTVGDDVLVCPTCKWPGPDETLEQTA